MNAERHFSVKEAQAGVFPSRSVQWIIRQVKAGAFGPVAADGGGWLIPESGLVAYLERHRVMPGADAPPGATSRNLVQFRLAK